jgi:hypothetical protein
VIATSEAEVWEKAQAQIDNCDADWCDPYITDWEVADLTLGSQRDLTDYEMEEYLEERRAEEEAVRAAEQRATRRANLNSIFASLRTAASEEERATRIDDLEQMIV